MVQFPAIPRVFSQATAQMRRRLVTEESGMTVTRTNFGPVAFVKPSGQLAAGTDDGALFCAIRGIDDPFVHDVFIDMGGVTQLDCWGIGELIRFRERVAASGRTFGLFNVDARQLRLLEMARLTDALGVLRLALA